MARLGLSLAETDSAAAYPAASPLCRYRRITQGAESEAAASGMDGPTGDIALLLVILACWFWLRRNHSR